MDDIKFRAWDTHRKKMWTPEEMGLDELTINPDGRGFVNVSGHSPSQSQYLPHLIPLQYTSLRDKNGKEYYAEDIFLKQNTKQIIRWNNDHAGWYLYWIDGGVSQPFFRILAESGENIGNMYENSELLQKEVI